MANKKLKFAVNPITGNLDLTNDVSQMVDGPASATDNAIARFDNTTGKLIQDSAVTVDDSGNVATSGQITVGSDATTSLQVVTKQQLDAAIGGVNVKIGVRAASTASIAQTGTQTIDGVALLAGDRILCKNQTNKTQNGIWIVDAGAWSRATDADTGAELEHALVTVAEGTTQANTGWYQTADNVTIGVTDIDFTQFFGAGTYTADGQGIELTGSTFSLELDGSTLSKSASGLRVASGGITNTEISASAGIALSKLGSALNYRIIITNGAGTVVENSAIAANFAIQSNSVGLPVASAVTATELGYLSGVTSAIQTQLNARVAYTRQFVTGTTHNAVANQVALCNHSAALAVTLPAATNNTVVVIKDSSGAAETNNITISPLSGTIDDEASIIINSNYGSVFLFADGTNWHIL